MKYFRFVRAENHQELQGEWPMYRCLYDVRQDPLERNNLAGNSAYLDQLRTMRQRCDTVADDASALRHSQTASKMNFFPNDLIEAKPMFIPLKPPCSLSAKRSKAVIVGWLLTLLWSSPVATAAEKTPPNVLWIMLDDCRAGAVSCYGEPWAETPNIDAIADRGVRFDTAIVQCMVCSPSRQSMLTGQYCHRLRHMAMGKTPESEQAYLPDEVTEHRSGNGQAGPAKQRHALAVTRAD